MRPGTRLGAAESRWRLRLVSAMPDAMRRWLTIFLFVSLLPVQLSWAGVSASSQHATAPTAQDVRQHDHQHKVAADQGDRNDPTVAGDREVDSSSCHAQGCASAIVGAVYLSSALSASSDAHIAYQIRVLPPPPPSLPERPNWADLA